MTLDEAIQRQKEAANGDCCGCAYMHCSDCYREHEQLAEWLEDYKSLKEHFDSLPDWIPVWVSCDEAMPKRDGYYLAYYTFLNGRHAYDIVYFNVGSPISNYITHWMPLPDPPKGEEI